MDYKVKILAIRFITHDVKQFVIEKPKGYKFIPGHFTDVTINKLEWKDELRPFTFTSLAEDLALEFTIKGYPDHKGMTEAIHNLKSGDELIIKEPVGTIEYKGPGVFIAAGAGVTPFIAIIRDLAKNNKLESNMLIFSNKKHEDIILEREFKQYFGEKCVFTLTKEAKSGYENKRVNSDFLKKYVKNFSQHFYICGPSQFVRDISEILKNLGASPDFIIFEK